VEPANQQLTDLFSRYENLELVLESLPEAIIVHDLERRVTFFNRAAERLTGLSRQEAIGQDCHGLLTGGFCGSRCAFCLGCDPGSLEEISTYPLVITDPQGARHRVEMTIVPMRDAQGQPVGVLAAARDITEITELRSAMARERSFRGLVGQHHLMQAVFELIREVAQTEVPVLILGESGTGKELVAAAIHSESARANHPFVAVNCGALPEGLIESELFGHVKGAFTGAVRAKQGRFTRAHTGTLFLDEIGELTLELQVKLLRVLETGTFEPVGAEQTQSADVRVISATNRDLQIEAAAERFRQDLFYRLAVVPIRLPPLRERRTDILLLADHFLARFAQEAGREPPALQEEAAQLLLDYAWPANVRELTNALQYALVITRGAVINTEHLPPELQDRARAEPARRVGRKPKLTTAAAQQAVEQAEGNLSRAARSLGVSRSTLYRHLKQD
jgi:PAS domain S-box-containing protein